jgi:IS4 transposase
VNGDLPDEPLTQLADEAAKHISEGTDWHELAQKLDVSRFRRWDSYPDWHDSIDFDVMLKSILWAKTEDDSLTGLSDRLEENPEIAQAMGFELSNIPHGDTFTYQWRNRFEEHQSRIERTAEQIDNLATERGSPIGTGGLNPKERRGSSERTERRALHEHTNQVIGQMANIVFPAFDLPRPDDCIYSEDELLRFEAFASVQNQAANGAADSYGDELFEEHKPSDDDPFYIDGPQGQTLLNDIHELDVEEITEMVNNAAERTIKRIKPYADFDGLVFLAIDITYVRYDGERDGLKWVTGAPRNKEYSYCYKFATATIVGPQHHMVVGVIPVGNGNDPSGDDYPGVENKNYRAGEVVRRLISIAKDHVDIKCVYADREFAAVDVFKALEEHRLKYLIPMPRNDRLKRWLSENVTDGNVVVEDGWVMHGPAKHGTSNEKIETTLIGLPGDPYDDQYGFGKAPDEDESHDPDIEPVPFATNLSVGDETPVERRHTLEKVEEYSRRGGIETAYKKIKELSSYTTSKDFSVRLFHFGFAVVLYNIWLMVDFLVQSSLPDTEVRPKPRITAKRFVKFLERRLLDFM